jgi:hypothetical protein
MQNDKLELLKLGSLQHLGENMLAFLLRVAASSHLPKAKAMEEEDKTGLSAAIYFDILVRCNYRNFIIFSCLDS